MRTQLAVTFPDLVLIEMPVPKSLPARNRLQIKLRQTKLENKLQNI